jgi:hypothetical protein
VTSVRIPVLTLPDENAAVPFAMLPLRLYCGVRIRAAQ